MQQPTRYYITTSGDKSTVRSVRVSRSVAEPVDSPDSDGKNQSEVSPAPHDREQREHGFNVKDLLPGAIRKRGPAL